MQALLYQKNMRECETICKECILDVIRDSIPVEKILRSYIDESNEEEIVEEIKETLEVDPSENLQTHDVVPPSIETTSAIVVKKSEELKTPLVKDTKEPQPDGKNEKVISVETIVHNTETPQIPKIPEVSKAVPEVPKVPEVSNVLKNIIEDNKKSLSFSDTDIAYDKKMKPTEVSAPKTIERLEKISAEAHKRRKEEEEEDDEEKLKIGGTVKLDILDIHDLEKDIKLKPDISNEIHVLT